jgi:deaminated glutathione amidase
MPKLLKIACLQTQPKSSIREALSEALDFAKKAVKNGADFLFFPEYCAGLVSENGKLKPPSSYENEHEFLLGMQRFSKENEVWIMIGSIAVSSSGGKIFNRGFVLDSLGVIISRYDKIHMFDIQLNPEDAIRESAFVSPGNKAIMIDSPFGNIGHTICYDLRFPELYRNIAKAGAEIICIPAAFTKKTGEAHWHILNRARAIENGVFVIAPCSIGKVPGGGEAYGHSLVINPWGKVIADGGTEPGIIYATIDLTEVSEARKKIPSLSHDRVFTTVVENQNKRSVA